MQYSKSTNGFYTEEIHAPAQIPADAIEITDDEYEAALAGQSAGGVITAGIDGKPIISAPPLPTLSQIAEAESDKARATLATLNADIFPDILGFLATLPSATPAIKAAATLAVAEKAKIIP